MWKIIIESLNSEQLRKETGLEDSEEKKYKSIGLLDAYLNKKFPINEINNHIQFLKNLNSLRQAHAHRKSSEPNSGYQKAIEHFNIGKIPFRQVFNNILQESTEFISFLNKLCGEST